MKTNRRSSFNFCWSCIKLCMIISNFFNQSTRRKCLSIILTRQNKKRNRVFKCWITCVRINFRRFYFANRLRNNRFVIITLNRFFNLITICCCVLLTWNYVIIFFLYKSISLNLRSSIFREKNILIVQIEMSKM